MKITSLSAKNFRTLEDIVVALGGNYCTISGRNNAGKSAITRIIQFFLTDFDQDSDFIFEDAPLVFSRDATQWHPVDEIIISMDLEIDRINDAEIFFVVEKISGTEIEGGKATLNFQAKQTKEGKNFLACKIGESDVDSQSTNLILKNFRSSSNLVVHNSTFPAGNFRYFGDKFTEVFEASFSEIERKKIIEAEARLSKEVNKVAKQHKEQLQALIGRMVDKYEVDLSSVESGRFSRFPLAIKMSDQSVTTGLADWGAGTQNRTRILTSFLRAILRRQSIIPEKKATPIFLVEEPESFLHPSAQAEFGKILNSIAEEHDIQIIATTHSPYMLNQRDPSSNILLERRMFRNKARETVIKDTTGQNWMLPFVENLGIIPEEFENWKSVFSAASNRVLFVEGEIDKGYFEFFKEKFPEIYSIPHDVEIYPYGGAGALENTHMLNFIKNRFGKMFVTYDLDVDGKVRPHLEKLGLCKGEDFQGIGKEISGQKTIEGLLPPRIRAQVYSQNEILVSSAALGVRNSEESKSAKNRLKRAFLEEIRKNPPDPSELTDFKKLFAEIKKAFSKN
jgi:putative ATP-dependent endonuclease of OLD family